MTITGPGVIEGVNTVEGVSDGFGVPEGTAVKVFVAEGVNVIDPGVVVPVGKKPGVGLGAVGDLVISGVSESKKVGVSVKVGG